MAISSSDSKITAFAPIYRAIRYTEWTFVVAIFLFIVISRFVTFNPNSHTPAKIGITCVCIGACALLSFIFPIDRPLWQRRAYIFLEILLILPTRITEWNFECFLYLFFAKSCFLLKRKDVVITVLTGAIAWELILIINMPGEIESICSRTPHLCARSRIFWQYILNDITGASHFCTKYKCLE